MFINFFHLSRKIIVRFDKFVSERFRDFETESCSSSARMDRQIYSPVRMF